MAEKPKTEQPTQPATSPAAPTQPDGFMQKMIAVFQEAMAQELVKFRAELKTSIDKIVKEQQDEAVKALKEGLGLEKDPVIHTSEIPGMIRKILLETLPSGKRTETTTTDVPAEGTDVTKTQDKTSSADKMFTEALKTKGAF